MSQIPFSNSKILPLLAEAVVAALLITGCGKEALSPSQGDGQQPTHELTPSVSKLFEAPKAETAPAERLQGVTIAVSTSDSTGRAMPIETFSRTIEKTTLQMAVTIASGSQPAGNIKVSLYSQGKVVDSTRATMADGSPLQLALKLKTPKLSSKDRDGGFARVNYDLQIESGNGQSHMPFSLLVYDASKPTYVEPQAGAECLIYHAPERASGCYQNRTRTTQEVVFNDSVQKETDVNVQFSGGVTIPISIVQLQLGAQKSTTKMDTVARGSEIHFTNCIECSSVIYRQEVESVRVGNIYRVSAAGSLEWAGSTTYRSKELAYEFTSTPSESQDYRCDLPSKLPVGTSDGCKAILDPKDAANSR